MNNLATLINFHIGYYIKPRFASKKERNKFIGILSMLSVCFLMPAGMLIASVYLGASIAAENNVLPEFMSVMFGGAEVATIFLGSATYINIMYFSRDNELLASLPIKSSHIYISKFVVCLISMLMISSLIVIPAFISSAVAITNAGITLGAEYYIMGIIGIFYVPLVPLAVISILAFPVMKIVSFLKRKPVLMSIVMVLFIVAVICAMYGGMYMLEGGAGKDEASIESLVNVLTNVGKASYATLVLSRIMLGVDIGVNIAILIGIVIGCLLINVGLSVLLYRSTLSNLGEGGVRKTASKKQLEYRQSSNKLALLKREVKTILRHPDFFVQTLMMIVLAPVMIVAFTMFDAGEDSEGNQRLFLTGMVFFYLTIMMGLNYLSTIGISREREKISLLKAMPISTRDIIKVKIWLADIASIVGCLVCSVTYVLCVDVPWYYMIFMFVTGILVSSSMNVFGLMRDAKKPNLKWVNAREIVKNNFGTIIPMLITMVMGIVVMIVTGTLAFTKLEDTLQELISWCIIFVLSLVYYFVFRFEKIDKIVRYFDEIEL